MTTPQCTCKSADYQHYRMTQHCEDVACWIDNQEGARLLFTRPFTDEVREAEARNSRCQSFQALEASQ